MGSSLTLARLAGRGLVGAFLLLATGWLVSTQFGGLTAKRAVADSLARSLAPLVCELLPNAHYQQQEVMAVVYPELLRYSPAQDVIEVEVNRRLYALHNLGECAPISQWACSR